MSNSPAVDRYDVIVIGAGHAGCEAALAAARAGCTTLVVTANLDRVGYMPCNPSVGGPGKSHLVAEVDALGGEMGRAADRTALQVRQLNTSRGPAVQAVRVQSDKRLYSLAMKEALETQPHLEIRQDEAVALKLEPATINEPDLQISGVVLRHSGAVSAKAVVITAGTFLRGSMISGESRHTGGRAGDKADVKLAVSLDGLGFQLRRLKTGTPPRIDARSVDLSNTELEIGSDEPIWLSRDGALGRLDLLNLPPLSIHRQTSQPGAWRPQLACYRLSTNQQTHGIIRANLHRAPMFNGAIAGIGPRYCPSIEDKVARFLEKDAHPIFLEPEGWRTTELYVQGMSTSLPVDVQDAALRTLPGLADVRITRYGYAVEYDAVDPAELTPTMESRRIAHLFLAGQINGTSGYEEAAGQGIIAGLNAANVVRGRPPVILRRDQAYIGVMIDDLVTKPFDEPYRMLTSRAEYRLLLRTDTADARLAAIAAEEGLIAPERARNVHQDTAVIAAALAQLETVWLAPNPRHTTALTAAGLQPVSRATTALELVRRPEATLHSVRAVLSSLDLPQPTELPARLAAQLEIAAKYGAFINKELRQVERQRDLEDRFLPPTLDYMAMSGLRKEAREKLQSAQPRSIGQASRLAGVTPADITVLLIHSTRLAAGRS